MGRLVHLVGDGISLGLGYVHVRVDYHGMVFPDGLATGDTGKHPFSPAGETTEVMRGDKTGENLHVGIGPNLIYPKLVAGGKRAQGDVVLVAIVADHRIILHDLFAEIVYVFLVRMRSVSTRSHQELDVFVFDAPVMQFGYEGEEKIEILSFIGGAAGIIGDDHAGGLFPLGDLGEPLGADGASQSLQLRLDDVGNSRILLQLQNPDQILIIQF